MSISKIGLSNAQCLAALSVGGVKRSMSCVLNSNTKKMTITHTNFDPYDFINN